MSNFTGISNGGGIKSIQRGIFNKVWGTNTSTPTFSSLIAVTAFTPGKAILLYEYRSVATTAANSSTTLVRCGVTAKLEGSNGIRIVSTESTTFKIRNIELVWQLVEFN